MSNAIIIACILVIWTAYSMPRITFIGNAHAPLVTVITGVHGNEPAPALYVEELARVMANRAIAPCNVQYAFVRANPAALLMGVRGITRDMNRTWHRPSLLRRIVDRSALVIDMHEAWGFEHVNPGSLGQTVYTTHPHLVPLVDRVVARLNLGIADPVHKFQRLRVLPPLMGTSLDMYCARRDVPYILIELAGQRDIVAPAVRRAHCETVLDILLAA